MLPLIEHVLECARKWRIFFLPMYSDALSIFALMLQRHVPGRHGLTLLSMAYFVYPCLFNA